MFIVSWPEGWTVCATSQPNVLMSTVSCEDIYRNTFFLLDWNLTKMSLQMNREPQTFSLSLNSLLKGFCCLAFISGTHVCRKGDKRSSACLNRYIRVFMGGKKSLCPPVWIMRQFRRSSGEDNQMKKNKKREFNLFVQLITWCYDKQQACFVPTRKYTTVGFHWYALIMRDSDGPMWVK